MRDILAEIVEKKRAIVADAKKRRPLDELKENLPCGTFRMAEHFRWRGWGLIAECKLQSPAKGRLTTVHSVTELADIYTAAGAAVLSVHTDPHFLGSNEDFAAVRARVDTPLLRKDFIIDPYQVYEARALGADAVLLIVRILTPEQLKELLYLTWSLGMDALVEVHDRADLAIAQQTPAEFIGINNRNLVTFETSVQTTLDLLPYADMKRTIISESGIFTRADALRVHAAGCKGVLVGEGLVRAADVGVFARELVNIKEQWYMGKKGRFGDYGGQYVPEIAMPALNELEAAYLKYREDDAFLTEFRSYLRDYAGRPTNLYFAERLTKHYGKANIYLKREDLLHTGAHKINNALGQALLAQRMGKKRIVAETGAGQHGVATATVAALFGMECHIFMGAVDVERQRLNVFRMRLLGATVIPVSSGTGTLKDATSEAIRYWATNITDTYYVIGSAVGPHPYPEMVRDFQKVIGEEIRAQAKERFDAKPDYLVACIGGGSNAIGTFYDFHNDAEVKKFCVEGGGRGDADGDNAKTLSGAGTPGILHGAYSYLLQDQDGQVVEAYSISAGLDYPGVGPEHSYFKDQGIVTYVSVTDKEALAAFQRLSRIEGIIPALESSHALAYLEKLMPETKAGENVVVCLSGRGDKDVQMVAKELGEDIA